MKLKALVVIVCLMMGSAIEGSAQSFLGKVLKGIEKTNEALDKADKFLNADGDNSQKRRSEDQRSHQGRPVSGFKIQSPLPDLAVQVQRCMASSSKVIIDLMVTNYSGDTTIDFYPYNNIVIDDQGQQYGMQVCVANGEWHSATSAAALFPTDVPIKVSIQISDIPESVQVLRRINLYLSCHSLNLRGTSSEPIKLFNVPIVRRSAITQAADPALSGEGSVRQTVLANETNGADKPIEVSNACSSRHPLMDPLLNQAGGHAEVYPRSLCYVKHQPNDWAILGLRGAVKSLQESYGNSTSVTVYYFDAKGFLELIQQGKDQFLFISKLSNPMQRKMFLQRNGKNEEQTPSDRELQNYVYDEQGRIVEQKPLDMHFRYDEQGLCNKIEYPELAMDSYDFAVVDITRNKWGDIVNLKIQVTSYEELYDQTMKRYVKGKQIGSPSVKNCPVKYIYDAHNNWVSCESELGKVKRTITYY